MCKTFPTAIKKKSTCGKRPRSSDSAVFRSFPPIQHPLLLLLLLSYNDYADSVSNIPFPDKNLRSHFLFHIRRIKRGKLTAANSDLTPVGVCTGKNDENHIGDKNKPYFFTPKI
jgi:hypothetical protein